MTPARVRREPPAFRRLELRRTEDVSPHMKRVVLGGSDLEGFRLEEPAASVRVLLPGDDGLEIPVWHSNEFLLADGSRPTIRTFTPRRFDARACELHIDVVLHGSGAASTWAETAGPDDQVAVSGPGRGYGIDPEATAFVLAGDETAIPAICQLLEYLPPLPIAVHLAVRHDDAKVDLHRDVDVTWHVSSDAPTLREALVDAIRTVELVPGVRLWAAGEAAAMQRIRKHLFDERGFSRSHANVRGYWKHTA